MGKLFTEDTQKLAVIHMSYHRKTMFVCFIRGIVNHSYSDRAAQHWHCCKFRQNSSRFSCEVVGEGGSADYRCRILPNKCACLNKHAPSTFWWIIPLKIGKTWSKMSKDSWKTPRIFLWSPWIHQGVCQHAGSVYLVKYGILKMWACGLLGFTGPVHCGIALLCGPVVISVTASYCWSVTQPNQTCVTDHK